MQPAPTPSVPAVPVARRVVILGEDHKCHDKSLALLKEVFGNIAGRTARILFAEELPSTRSLTKLAESDDFYRRIEHWKWAYCPFDDPQFDGIDPETASEYLHQHHTREQYMLQQLKPLLAEHEIVFILCGLLHVPFFHSVVGDGALVATTFSSLEFLWLGLPTDTKNLEDAKKCTDNAAPAVVEMYTLRVQRWQALQTLAVRVVGAAEVMQFLDR